MGSQGSRTLRPRWTSAVVPPGAPSCLSPPKTVVGPGHHLTSNCEYSCWGALKMGALSSLKRFRLPSSAPDNQSVTITTEPAEEQRHREYEHPLLKDGLRSAGDSAHSEDTWTRWRPCVTACLSDRMDRRSSSRRGHGEDGEEKVLVQRVKGDVCCYIRTGRFT